MKCIQIVHYSNLGNSYCIRLYATKNINDIRTANVEALKQKKT